MHCYWLASGYNSVYFQAISSEDVAGLALGLGLSMSAMALLVGIVLTLISVILCVRHITKQEVMRTAANVAYDARDERLRERDDLPPPLPPRNEPVCPEYATIANPDGAKPSNKDESFVVNTKEYVEYDVVQNKWSTDTLSYSGYTPIAGTTSCQGDPAKEVINAHDVLENEVDFKKRSSEVGVKDNIAYNTEPKEESCDYVIISDGITIKKVFL